MGNGSWSRGLLTLVAYMLSDAERYQGCAQMGMRRECHCQSGTSRQATCAASSWICRPHRKGWEGRSWGRQRSLPRIASGERLRPKLIRRTMNRSVLVGSCCQGREIACLNSYKRSDFQAPRPRRQSETDTLGPNRLAIPCLSRPSASASTLVSAVSNI